MFGLWATGRSNKNATKFRFHFDSVDSFIIYRTDDQKRLCDEQNCLAPFILVSNQVEQQRTTKLHFYCYVIVGPSFQPHSSAVESVPYLLFISKTSCSTAYPISNRSFFMSSFLFPQFVHINNLKLICRAHQLVHEGYKYMFDETLVTVWSAPNYCYRCGNIASILAFSDADTREPKLFKAVPDCDRVIPPRTTTPYFL